MLHTPHIAQTTAQPIATVHVSVSRTNAREAMVEGYYELMRTVAEQNIRPAGPWFTHHLRRPTDTFEFDIGVPLAEPLQETDRVKAGEMPAMTIAHTVYQGAYEGLPEAWAVFDSWMKEEGHRPRPDLWERYLVGPDSNAPPEEWQTELMRPIAQDR